MKLLLHSLNYSPELTGIGKYNGEMCPVMVDRGHTVYAVVAPPYYPEWEVHKGYESAKYVSQFLNGVRVTRCPVYVPKKVTTVKRVLHLLSFTISSFGALISKITLRPDVVILVQPTLFCAPFTLFYCFLTRSKSVMHIQDFEVDAMLGLGMSSNKWVGKLARGFERFMLRRFDAISTISYSMMKNAEAKGVDKDKLIFFPNWSDIDFVTPNTCGRKLKAEWGFQEHDKIVLYAGNISLKQGLDIVIEAAKSFSENESVKFVMVGAGAYVSELESLAQQANLSNVFFKPLQPWEKVPQMLALADLHLVIQKKGAADAVLPSKLTNILAAGGNAIVTAEPNTELGAIESKHPGIYDLIEPESTKVLIQAIKNHFKKGETAPNMVARTYAENNLNKDAVIDQYCRDLNNLVESGGAGK
ncbi:colanic acid biosynthesis glycosyltransferase WcaI [Alteromonas sediminis]|uniref:Colanic acid biosynthesis glycosyltransferase WcaI n=1 Tax=Alteromonas sediminis TaxID=2259342 RepID=A0A3N5Y3K4_9ALTE|nr:WcaI family glycosyltransferase [Alteromonas sediminis]RPJ68512.1 colanic acid biosynthesis glycosyltransferase WcaI [Alteromonas sediminis]